MPFHIFFILFHPALSICFSYPPGKFVKPLGRKEQFFHCVYHAKCKKKKKKTSVQSRHVD